MGKLKWDVETVHQSLDELEEIIQKVKPIQARIDRRARKLRKMKHLPQYVTQRIDNLISNNIMADRSFASVRSVRSALPEVERQGKKKRYPALVEGMKYRVVLGGSFITQKYQGQYSYFAHDESKNLHVGDIIIYRGQQAGLLTRDNGKPKDAFELDSFVGVFTPNANGKANRAYLQKVEGA